MPLYVQSGDRTWHKIDGTRQAELFGKAAYATTCGSAILKQYEPKELAQAPGDLCPLCAKNAQRPLAKHVAFKS